MQTLMFWQLRQIFALNVIAAIAAAWWAVFDSSVLTALHNPPAALLVLGHGGLMTFLLGRGDPRRTGFLYAQGFSRDQIWWSTWLATMVSALVVAGTVWLCIFLRLRSVLQEWYGNPWFPLVGADEAISAFTLLMMYAVVLAVAHFVWVRARLPEPDPGAGWVVALALMLVAGLCREAFRHSSPTETFVLTGCWALLALVLVIVCWRLHRRSEVQV